MTAYFQATGDSEGVDTLDGVVTGSSAPQFGDIGDGVSISLSFFS